VLEQLLRLLPQIEGGADQFIEVAALLAGGEHERRGERLCPGCERSSNGDGTSQREAIVVAVHCIGRVGPRAVAAHLTHGDSLLSQSRAQASRERERPERTNS